MPQLEAQRKRYMQYLLLVAVAGTVLIAEAGVLAVNEGVVVTVSAAAVVVVVASDRGARNSSRGEQEQILVLFTLKSCTGRMVNFEESLIRSIIIAYVRILYYYYSLVPSAIVIVFELVVHELSVSVWVVPKLLP